LFFIFDGCAAFVFEKKIKEKQKQQQSTFDNQPSRKTKNNNNQGWSTCKDASKGKTKNNNQPFDVPSWHKSLQVD